MQTHVEGSFYACWFADYVLQVDGENVSVPSFLNIKYGTTLL